MLAVVAECIALAISIIGYVRWQSTGLDFKEKYKQLVSGLVHLEFFGLSIMPSLNVFCLWFNTCAKCIGMQGLTGRVVTDRAGKNISTQECLPTGITFRPNKSVSREGMLAVLVNCNKTIWWKSSWNRHAVQVGYDVFFSHDSRVLWF